MSQTGQAPAGRAGPADKPAWLRGGLPPAVILLLALVFFSPFLLHGKIFLAADTLYSFYPWRFFAAPNFRAHNQLITDPVNYGYPMAYNRQLKAGHLQQWNPLVMGGVPAVNSNSTGSPGRYYPVKFLSQLFFKPYIGLMVFYFVQLVLMGWFMYLYLMEIGAGYRGSVFGAAAWMFSGHAMVWFTFEIVATAGAFLPLLLLLCERFRSPRRWFAAAAGMLVLGMIFVCGHLQYALYLGVMLIFYFLHLCWRAWRDRSPLREYTAILGCFLVTGLGGLLIGAVDLLPMAEVLRNSSRVGRVFDFQGLFNTLGRVPFRWLVTLIFPDYFGSPVLRFNLIPSLPGQEYMNYNELCLYLGIPTLFALLAALFRPRRRYNEFYLLLTVLVVLMLAGTIVFWPFFTFFPGLNKVNPTRMIFLFTFAACVAAALGVRTIEELSRRARAWYAGACGLLLGGMGILALIGSSPGAVSFFNRETLAQNPAAAAAILGEIGGLRTLGSPLILKPLLLACAAAFLFAAFALLVEKSRAGWAAFGLIVALLAYDLISFGWYYNTTVDPQIIYPPTPAIQFLQRQPGPFRVVQDSGSGLYVNTLAPFGIEELGGYVNAYPERVHKMLSFIENGERSFYGASFDRWVMFRRHTSRLYDLMNVRYLLTNPYTQIGDPRFRLVFQQDLSIWENTRALPRAFAVHRATRMTDIQATLNYMESPAFDMAGEVLLEEGTPPAPGPASGARPDQVTITRYAEDDMAITAELGTDGWLVLSNNWYPGWEALVDGKPAPVLRADGALMAVPLAAGRHAVQMRYRPTSITWGKILTILGLLLAGAGMFFARRRRNALP